MTIQVEHANPRGFYDPDAIARKKLERRWVKSKATLEAARARVPPRWMQRKRKAEKAAQAERERREALAREKIAAMEVKLGLRMVERWPEPGEMTPEALRSRQERLLERSYALQDRVRSRV